MRELITTTLIIRFSSVGDIILSTPLIRVLRRAYPESRIDFLVKSTYAELLQGNPHLSRVIAFDGAGGIPALRQLRKEVRHAGYDRILDIHDSLRSRFLCAGMPGVRRYRKRKIARAVLVHFHRDTYPLFGGAPHVTGRYLETVSDLGIRDDDEGPELFPSPADSAAAMRLLPEGPEGWVGVCPSARHETKIWPPERFAFAAAVLAERHGLGITLLGATADIPRCDDVEGMIRRQFPAARIVNATGKLTLLQSAALMDRCAVILTNDSGLMHVASARKRPLVAIFGSTSGQLGFTPYGASSLVVERHDVPCRPCTAIGRASCPKGHFRCMRDISGEQVVAAATSILRT